MSPSAPSGPRQSTRAGREPQDIAVARSLQTAGGTPPCWTQAGNQSYFLLPLTRNHYLHKIVALAARQQPKSKLKKFPHTSYSMLYRWIRGHTKLIRLFPVPTWTILALFSGSVSSGKSESTSGALSPSSIGCSSSDTWHRAGEKPQASCQLQLINGGKQGQIPQSPAAHLQ